MKIYLPAPGFLDHDEAMRRLTWLILPSGFVLVALLAWVVEPSPLGYGTHRALGLPPCLFLALTGFFCPSCGLTTSFAHLAHGHWQAAFAAHPLGPIFALLFALLSLFSLLEFFGTFTPLRKFLQGHYVPWLYAGVTVYFIVWGGRLLGEFL